MSLATFDVSSNQTTICYHCHQPCDNGVLNFGDKQFCCEGCRAVYQILSDNDLCDFYVISENPGKKQSDDDNQYLFLDEPEVRQKLIIYEIDAMARVQFSVPTIHCASCIWLLENLSRLHKSVIRAEVNFVRKTVTVDFLPREIRLSELAQLLASIGYHPAISLSDDSEQMEKAGNNKLLIKLAIAGFCFGNIMLLSFPEYLGLDQADALLETYFSWISLLLAVPVIGFSASGYFQSALRSYRQRQVNIDVPIALGLVVLFVRSAYDILWHVGPGYLDSLAGLVFFLLIGRWFQDKTYETLSFERDYRSYFPLAVLRWDATEWKSTLIKKLKKGDRLQIRNNEIVPADSWLSGEGAMIDYSFVTGESKPVRVKEGEKVYAGGKVIGAPTTMRVDRPISQSHLTSLWNHDAFKKKEGSYRVLIDRVARVFTWVILALAFVTGLFWFIKDPTTMWPVVTAVLIVACPCALALAAPFTYGSLLRAFGRHGLFLKNADIVEKMARIDSVVFDKTGTVTHGKANACWFGCLSTDEQLKVKQLTAASTHPLSSIISRELKGRPESNIEQYAEIPGKGILATIDGCEYRIGSAAFVGVESNFGFDHSTVYVSIDQELRGYFQIRASVRNGLPELARRMNGQITALLSGDGPQESAHMRTIFSDKTQMAFNQGPHDKLQFVKNLQQQGARVMMVGDGLNDSGALKQSDVGIAVSDDASVFTPASDGIIMGSLLPKLDQLLITARQGVGILKAGFAISFLYNLVGISFAASGHLSPLVAAILMPISSISVVAFSTLSVSLISRKLNKP
ncbi:MAG: heavy metal translocating P-type ATPase [Cyclobacteriaceae bacterium]